jgi:hypothetical protein
MGGGKNDGEPHKRDKDGRLQDGVATYPADAHDMQTFVDARDALSQLPAPTLYRSNNPHERLFVAAFDGTGNDANRDPAHMTNVGRFRDQIEALEGPDADRIKVGYVEGPGTQRNAIARAIDGARGHTYEQRLEEMYDQLAIQTKRWLAEDPDAQVRVVSVGFSRGAEQAAGFTRLVHERGIQDIDGARVVRDEHGQKRIDYTAPALAAPGQTPQAVGLFDPVGTGVPRDHDRRLPPSVISGFQITAEDERRSLFKSTSIIDPGQTPDGRFLNVMVAGAHSDVGGSYHLDGLSSRSGNLMTDYMNALSDRPFLNKVQEPSDPAMNVVHRSEQGMFLYRITPKVDRREDEGTVERLAPDRLVGKGGDAFNAEPRDERMAAAFDWRRVSIGVVPPEAQARSAAAQSPTTEPPARPQDPSVSGHPDHGTYRNLHGMVQGMHAQNGIAADDAMNRQASLALLAAYKRDGAAGGALRPEGGIDGVVLSQSSAQNPEVGGKFAILYQGDPNSPTVRNLAVPTRDLMQAPEQSLQQIDAANQQLQQAQQRSQTQAPPQPTQQPSIDPNTQQPGMGPRSLF